MQSPQRGNAVRGQGLQEKKGGARGIEKPGTRTTRGSGAHTNKSGTCGPRPITTRSVTGGRLRKPGIEVRKGESMGICHTGSCRAILRSALERAHPSGGGSSHPQQRHEAARRPDDM